MRDVLAEIEEFQRSTTRRLIKTISIAVDQDLWDSLSEYAHEQSILKRKRFPAVQALRLAIRVFLRLEPEEISEILKRDPHNIG